MNSFFFPLNFPWITKQVKKFIFISLAFSCLPFFLPIFFLSHFLGTKHSLRVPRVWRGKQAGFGGVFLKSRWELTMRRSVLHYSPNGRYFEGILESLRSKFTEEKKKVWEVDPTLGNPGMATVYFIIFFPCTCGSWVLSADLGENIRWPCIACCLSCSW